jgi:hypothetical protein
MNRSFCGVLMGVAGLVVLGMTATLASARCHEDKDNFTRRLGAVDQRVVDLVLDYCAVGEHLLEQRHPKAGSAMAQAPDAGCALPSEPKDIPAAIDAAISGPADRDRACMKALLIPEARMTFVSLGADGAPSYRLESLEDWIARVKARGHATLEEKQLKFHIERYGNIAHLWSSYALHSDGKQVARGINSIQAIKEGGGWRVVGIMLQAESATAPLPKEYLP